MKSIRILTGHKIICSKKCDPDDQKSIEAIEQLRIRVDKYAAKNRHPHGNYHYLIKNNWREKENRSVILMMMY